MQNVNGVTSLSVDCQELPTRRQTVRDLDRYFTDKPHSANGRRPLKFQMFMDTFGVAGFKTTYVAKPVKFRCTMTHVEILQDIKFTEIEFDVLGFTSGSTCSPLEQQISLDITFGTAVSTSVNTDKSSGFGSSTGFSLAFKTGLNEFIISKIGYGESLNADMSNTLSTGNSVTTGEQNDNSAGTAINYQGPGIALLVGFQVRYKVLPNINGVKAKLHYTCKEGSEIPTETEIKFEATSFGNVFFLDFQHQFSNTDICENSTYPQECVSSIVITDYIKQPDKLEEVFRNCFSETKSKIPFENCTYPIC